MFSKRWNRNIKQRKEVEMKKIYAMTVIFLLISINSSANWSNWGGGNIGTGIIKMAENSQVEMKSMKRMRTSMKVTKMKTNTGTTTKPS